MQQPYHIGATTRIWPRTCLGKVGHPVLARHHRRVYVCRPMEVTKEPVTFLALVIEHTTGWWFRVDSRRGAPTAKQKRRAEMHQCAKRRRRRLIFLGYENCQTTKKAVGVFLEGTEMAVNPTRERGTEQQNVGTATQHQTNLLTVMIQRTVMLCDLPVPGICCNA